jgi:hypothetical protein
MGEVTVSPCSYQAAKYAVERWHYSRRMPQGKLLLLGVWQCGRFIGAVIFGRGANDSLLRPYGLGPTEGCELVRVALRDHEQPVTQIIAGAICILRRTNPGLRLIVSYADPNEGHHGGIYQAGNWIFTGKTPVDVKFLHRKTGKLLHSRVVSSSGIKVQFGKATRVPRPAECDQIPLLGKYRYVYPLDKQIRRKVSRLAQPYPSAVEASTVTRPSSAREGWVQLPATAPSNKAGA